MKEVNIKPFLMQRLSLIPENEVAVFLSSGIDSISCVFGLLELGKKPVGYTFHLDGWESMDLKGAREVCEEFKIPHVTIPLKMSCPDYLVSRIGYMKDNFNLWGKADLECMFPFFESVPYVKESAIAFGLDADTPYLLTKKAMIHLRDDPDAARMIYRDRIVRDDHDQIHALNKMFGEVGKTCYFPYFCTDMVDALIGTSWNDVNKPKEKMPILNMFPEEFARIKVRKHSGLQKGDSKIGESYEILLKSHYNTRLYKSVVGIYNEI